MVVYIYIYIHTHTYIYIYIINLYIYIYNGKHATSAAAELGGKIHNAGAEAARLLKWHVWCPRVIRGRRPQSRGAKAAARRRNFA